ncbi:MAG: hypothetical protein KDC12_04860 [Flavobacteriales bacterium]|nr:hypothetical protein [Flavobacteriales bacterium]
MTEARELILKLIEEKARVKQDVFFNTKERFAELKDVLDQTMSELQESFGDRDNRITMYYKSKGEYEAEVKIAGDILIFHMHTNVFQFDKSHSLWRSSYLKDDESNGFVGVINIYNFLADSFKFHRQQDIGYLVARVFVNRDNHFLVQGKRQLGFLYNDFIGSELTKEKMIDIVESTILYTLDFDMLTPPYQNMQEVTVEQIQALSDNLNIITGKRLGFRFSSDDDGAEFE